MASDVEAPSSPGVDLSPVIRKEQLKHEFELKRLERQVADEHAARLRAENQVRHLTADKDSIESDSAAMFEKMINEQKELRKKIDFYEQEVAKFSNQASELSRDLNSAKANIVDKDMQLSAVQLELKAAQEKLQNAEYEKQASGFESDKTVQVLRIDLNARNDEISALKAQLESIKQQYSSDECVSGQLSEYVAKARALEQELASVRKEAQEGQLAKDLNLFLEEEKLQLKREIETMSSTAKENRLLQEKVARLEAEKEIWVVYLRGHSDLSSPQDLAKKVSDLTLKNKALSAKVSSLEHDIQLKATREQSEQVVQKQIELESAQDELSATKIKLSQRKFEIDNLRKEVQLLEAHLDKKDTDSDLQARLDQAQATIENLRKQVSDLEKEYANLNNDQSSKKRRISEAMLSSRSQTSSKLEQVESELQEKSRQLEIAQLDLESSKKRVEQLELASKSDTKVVELKGSPFEADVAPRLALLDALEREVQDLRKMQEENYAPEYVPRSSLLTLKVEYDVLKDQRAQLESKHQSFQKAIAIREARLNKAIDQLFGYNIELLSDRTCLLRPELEPETVFEAQFDDIDRKYTSFRVTDNVRAYESLYKHWALERKCLPGFLSAVLLELIDKKNN
ncbi:Spindle assembly checkpoint component MAD1 [Wickerhamiella sorbophila]|uniref:Spindle assembly checkpoint component MAD1 n=1 Tax=Wickerhamiella sorbophila TaxID=45607 RepID=A0A2T0FNQ9_9ASCO|nr:Spindle assembly checkpoint component MAD1 [Wickerhamiella sorbophila]PRT56617.1 Spindle assembly checkpoint component MAD1 [Wickerhamiella sorbophila]